MGQEVEDGVHAEGVEGQWEREQVEVETQTPKSQPSTQNLLGEEEEDGRPVHTEP